MTPSLGYYCGLRYVKNYRDISGCDSLVNSIPIEGSELPCIPNFLFNDK